MDTGVTVLEIYYPLELFRVKGVQFQEVLHVLDFFRLQPLMDRPFFSDVLQPPYLISKAWWEMLLVHCSSVK